MLIENAVLADGRERDVRIEGERIDAVDERLAVPPDERTIDAAGQRLLPGMIDVHVHFREPGFPHKETWATGSRAAAAGGVTAVVDQPNTDPPTVDGERFDGKADLAADSLVDYGINGGVTPDWDPDSLFDRPLVALGEVFLADSTGEMGIDADLFADAVAAAAERDVPVTVHAEDADLFDEDALAGAGDGTGRDADADAWSAYRTAAAEIAAVERAAEVAATVAESEGEDSSGEVPTDGNSMDGDSADENPADGDDESGDDESGSANGDTAAVHVAHTSTPEAVDVAAEAGLTCEVTPHHVLLSRADLEDLGTFGRMNPPLREEERRAALFERVVDGTVDVVATDHAPHAVEEKTAPIDEAPSGVPGVETALPLLLALAGDDGTALDYERVRDLTATNPAEIFGLPDRGRVEAGAYADLVLFDSDDVRTVDAETLHSKCGWTPFEGFDAVFPTTTVVRGSVVYERDPGERFHGHRGENVRSI